MKKYLWLAWVFIQMICMTTVCFAADFEGVTFSQDYESEYGRLQLKGGGTKSFLFRKAFVAGLYAPDGLLMDDVLTDQAKRIEVYYFVSVPGRHLSSYTERKMKKNVTSGEFLYIKQDVKKMYDYFVDLEPGDRYALTYIPEIGTQFHHNGDLKGVIPGERFAKAIFSVWLGKYPMDRRLKEKLLGVNLISRLN